MVHCGRIWLRPCNCSPALLLRKIPCVQDLSYFYMDQVWFVIQFFMMDDNKSLITRNQSPHGKCDWTLDRLTYMINCVCAWTLDQSPHDIYAWNLDRLNHLITCICALTPERLNAWPVTTRHMCLNAWSLDPSHHLHMRVNAWPVTTRHTCFTRDRLNYLINYIGAWTLERLISHLTIFMLER